MSNSVAALEESEQASLSPSNSTRQSELLSIDRVKDAANRISARVRNALLPAGFRPFRVLVVDDHPDAADALAAVVELLGCEVRVCYTGLSAMAVAEAFDPQVCLLDLMMPGMDGLELATRLKARAHARPLMLVATTALGDLMSRTQTALCGFHIHLTKPVDVTTLIDSLTQLGEIVAQHDTPNSHRPNDSQ